MKYMMAVIPLMVGLTTTGLAVQPRLGMYVGTITSLQTTNFAQPTVEKFKDKVTIMIDDAGHISVSAIHMSLLNWNYTGTEYHGLGYVYSIGSGGNIITHFGKKGDLNATFSYGNNYGIMYEGTIKAKKSMVPDMP